MPKLGHHDPCHFGNGVKLKRRRLRTDETEAFGEVPLYGQSFSRADTINFQGLLGERLQR